jgi:hypothetical protein
MTPFPMNAAVGANLMTTVGLIASIQVAAITLANHRRFLLPLFKAVIAIFSSIRKKSCLDFFRLVTTNPSDIRSLVPAMFARRDSETRNRSKNRSRRHK